MVGAVLLAAGSGNRMKKEVEDKLLHPIGHSNAFTLSCLAFLHSERITSLVIVHKDDAQLPKLQECLSQQPNQPESNKIYWVLGGKERQDSVWAGINKLPKEITHVLVHDCARPFIRSSTINQIAHEILKDKAVTVAKPLKDTLRLRTEYKEDSLEPSTTRTIDRRNHWLMETPQGAPMNWLIKGLDKARNEGILITDDMAAIELIDQPVCMLESGYPNPKITTPEDFLYAEFLLQS